MADREQVSELIAEVSGLQSSDPAVKEIQDEIAALDREVTALTSPADDGSGWKLLDHDRWGQGKQINFDLFALSPSAFFDGLRAVFLLPERPRVFRPSGTVLGQIQIILVIRGHIPNLIHAVLDGLRLLFHSGYVLLQDRQGIHAVVEALFAAVPETDAFLSRGIVLD